MTSEPTIEYNANGPLPLLRIIDAEGPQSQRQLAKSLGLTFAGVSFHLKKMLADGMLIESCTPPSKRGRPSIIWDIDRSHNATIGVIISPPKMELCVSDFADNAISQETHRLTKKLSAKDILATIDVFIAKAIKSTASQGIKLRQAFVGVPGHLSPETGKIIDCPNMPVLSGIDFENHIEKKFGIKTMAQAANYAIYAGEIERFEPNTVGMLITWELGIGVLFGCNEDIYNFLGQSGKKYRSLWDIGHMRAVKGGKECTCGKRGCLEAYASGWAMLEQMGNKADTLEEFISLVKSGNNQACEIFRKATKFLAKHMANIVLLMGIERIVIAGPLAEIFELTQKEFQAGLCNLLDADEAARLNPIASTDSSARAAIGASRMAKFAFLDPETLLQRRRDMAQSQKTAL